MGLKVTNNAFGTLNAGINSSVTTIVLSAGEGARFPTLTASDYFYATLIDTSNNLEIVKVTARSTDTMTVVRAQDNTTARAFSTNDRFELRPTAALFNEKANDADVIATYLPKAGGTMTGKLTIQATNYTLKLDGTSRSDIELVHTGAGSNLKRRIIRSIDGEFRLGLEDDASTSYTNHLNIDSSGRLTKPYQPAFFAHTYSTSGPVIGSYITVLFTTVVTNRGSHYNAGTGVYTCPVAGDYYVHCNLNLRAVAADWSSVFILKNNTQVIQSWSQPSADNQYDNNVVNCVLNCAANDTIIFAFYTGYTVPNTAAGYNHASIYLLG